jgi:Fe-S cluster assembly protein SufB
MADTKFLDESYKYDFKTKAQVVFTTGKGLNEEVVRAISKHKNEPEWMLEYRLKALKAFEAMPLPKYGPDLKFLDFPSYTYYTGVSSKEGSNWQEVPEAVKNTFDRLGIPEAEQKYLSGVTTQYESEVVYHNMLDEVQKKGVIFLSTDMALQTCPELMKKYFGTVVPFADNKFAALNGAVWSGGSFIYVPKGVHLDKPLQSYFRINNEKTGQFERTLIIVDEGADINYVEGCTAPIYSKESLHAAVVEIVVLKGARCRYTTVQNWSNNIVNMVTQRALVMENGLMEWVDGNIGSMRNMKYPACILKGDGGDTIPTNEIKNSTSYIEHEATVSKINEEELFYLMSRGLSEADATQMIVMGFIEPFSRELPMEYAVELNQLIKLDMSDSIG